MTLKVICVAFIVFGSLGFSSCAIALYELGHQSILVTGVFFSLILVYFGFTFFPENENKS